MHMKYSTLLVLVGSLAVMGQNLGQEDSNQEVISETMSVNEHDSTQKSSQNPPPLSLERDNKDDASALMEQGNSFDDASAIMEQGDSFDDASAIMEHGVEDASVSENVEGDANAISEMGGYGPMMTGPIPPPEYPVGSGPIPAPEYPVGSGPIPPPEYPVGSGPIPGYIPGYIPGSLPVDRSSFSHSQRTSSSRYSSQSSHYSQGQSGLGSSSYMGSKLPLGASGSFGGFGTRQVLGSYGLGRTMQSSTKKVVKETSGFSSGQTTSIRKSMGGTVNPLPRVAVSGTSGKDYSTSYNLQSPTRRRKCYIVRKSGLRMMPPTLPALPCLNCFNKPNVYGPPMPLGLPLSRPLPTPRSNYPLSRPTPTPRSPIVPHAKAKY
jgi:hypothetical protein